MARSLQAGVRDVDHKHFLQSWILAAISGLLLALVATSGLGQDVSLSGGNLSLTFVTPTAGSDFADVVDSGTCSLSWTKPRGPGYTQISVQTNINNPTATLSVLATNVSGGQSSGSITLNTSGQTLVRSLQMGSGGCDLEYTASVSLTDGTATEVHTVTFTITN